MFIVSEAQLIVTEQQPKHRGGSVVQLHFFPLMWFSVSIVINLCVTNIKNKHALFLYGSALTSYKVKL